MKRGKLMLCVFFFALLIVACKDADYSANDSNSATKEWISKTMTNYYLWADELPSIAMSDYQDPSEYFADLLHADDKWSYITDDYASLAAEMLSGTPLSMGYSPLFFRFSNESNNLGMVVEYVYPNSPASEAGIKRGDIIYKINDTQLTLSNYSSLYAETSCVLETAVIQGGVLMPTGISISLEARIVEADPSICYKIIENNGTKVGYFFYASFVTGTNDVYLKTIENIMSYFKSNAVDELIVDLRYNGGGNVEAARFLASSIVPQENSINQTRMINLKYNNAYEQYLKAYSPDNLYYNFEKVQVNLNLDHIYFLTTGSSASASELTIVGLQPYMDVKIVGEYTYGKYTGMYVFADEKEEWGMLPVCMKYANSQGYTDFAEGLKPDIEVQDDWTNFYELGDVDDPMIQAVFNDLNGVEQQLVERKKLSKFKPIDNKAVNPLKKNAFVVK